MSLRDRREYMARCREEEAYRQGLRDAIWRMWLKAIVESQSESLDQNETGTDTKH